jgi:hypothetical protein
VELERGTAELYMRQAYAQMLGVADRLGDQRVNDRPIGTGDNAVAALIVHCCGVTEFWIGHVALGRSSHRDRDSEFTSIATVAELHAMVDTTLAQVSQDLAAIDAERRKPTGRDGSSSRAVTNPTARSCSTCSRSCTSTSGTWRSRQTP